MSSLHFVCGEYNARIKDIDRECALIVPRLRWARFVTTVKKHYLEIGFTIEAIGMVVLVAVML